MLVMTTILTSKIEELPPTSDMKMIDIWLIFCLVVPFLEVILRTAIESVNCTCHLCHLSKSDPTDKVTPTWVSTAAPQQVENCYMPIANSYFAFSGGHKLHQIKKEKN